MVGRERSSEVAVVITKFKVKIRKKKEKIARGVSALSARAVGPTKGNFCGVSQDFPFSRGCLPMDMLRRAIGISITLENRPKSFGAGSLRTIRPRDGTFQRDILWGISGISVYAGAHPKGTCCGESQGNPFARRVLPMRNGVGSLRSIRSL